MDLGGVEVVQLGITTHTELSQLILIIAYLNILIITEMNLHHLDTLLDVLKEDIKGVLLKIYKSNGNSNKEYVHTLN